MASEPLLSDLPDEIQLKILSYCGPEDLCLNIAEVCKKWNVLAKDVSLWKKLSYECDSSSDISRITEVLTAAPALHSLIVCDRQDAAHILKLLIDKNVELRKLLIKRCWLGEDSTGLLTNIVEKYRDLEVLSLEGCRPLTSDSYSPIAQLKKLSELNLSYCQGLSGKTVRLIADSCQHLKTLSLDGVRTIDDGDVIHVIKKLGEQLTNLILEGNDLTDVAYSYLRNCARLQELRVTQCDKMTDSGLLEGIASLQELTSLRLSVGSNLTAEALFTFLHRPSMTSIVFLDLSACSNLDDEGLKGIAKSCINLKELALCWCNKVTDEGITSVIRHCNQLHVLNLKGVLSITGEGFLALVPSHLPHLRVLCLEDCRNVRDEYIEDLVAALPELLDIK